MHDATNIHLSIHQKSSRAMFHKQQIEHEHKQYTEAEKQR